MKPDSSSQVVLKTVPFLCLFCLPSARAVHEPWAGPVVFFTTPEHHEQPRKAGRSAVALFSGALLSRHETGVSSESLRQKSTGHRQHWTPSQASHWIHEKCQNRSIALEDVGFVPGPSDLRGVLAGLPHTTYSTGGTPKVGGCWSVYCFAAWFVRSFL